MLQFYEAFCNLPAKLFTFKFKFKFKFKLKLKLKLKHQAQEHTTKAKVTAYCLLLTAN